VVEVEDRVRREGLAHQVKVTLVEVVLTHHLSSVLAVVAVLVLVVPMVHRVLAVLAVAVARIALQERV
jgi:hypothetical protein